MALYPKIMQMIASPTKKSLEDMVELPEGIVQRDDDTPSARAIQFELHLKLSSSAPIGGGSIEA